MISLRRLLLGSLFALIFSTGGNAQNVTYHLHKDASSTTNLFQLKSAGPDAAAFAITSVNLKNKPAGEYLIKEFDTQSGVPSKAGVIPSGSTISFTLWIRKTANSGVIYPRAKLFVNNSSGALLGIATGTTAITTTLTQYNLSLTTSSAITMTASDRFYLWVGVNLTTAPTTNASAELDVEGTLNGNYNSRIVVPLPNSPPSVSITSPINGTFFNAPANITISANASDADGTISKVEFFQGSTKLGESTTSPYQFTWNNVAPASYGYTLTAKATDNGGAITTSGAVNVGVSGSGAIFDSLVQHAGSSSLNLTNEGTTDWVHWGRTSISSFDRKSGVTPQISNYTLIGTQAVQRKTDSIVSHTWTDGTPTASSTGTTTGIFTSAANNGFQFTVPADTTLKTLKLYFSLWAAQAKLEATLSDQSAPALIDTSFSKSGLAHGVYTINFKAASAGQTLTVKYTVLTDYSPPFGNVAIESVTLSVPPVGTGSLTGSLATPSASINLTSEGVTDWTHWGLGSATAFDHKAGVPSQISNFTKVGSMPLYWLNDNPTVFSWSDGTPTASATNTASGSFIQTAGNGFQLSVPADTTQKTLKVYLGLWRAQGKLEAALSDGSAPPYVDSSLSNSLGTSNGVYTLVFRAGANNQSLKIRYTDVQDFVSGGNVTLEAATLTEGPAIVTVSPSSGGIGDSITITGSSFGALQGTSTISFNGTLATPTSWGSNSIVVPVPAGATTGPVVVTVGDLSSNGSNFTVTPKITGLVPASGGVGELVTINGSSFGATQETSTVAFNGTPAAPTNWSDTSIVVPVPASASTGPVVVTVNTLASNPVTFTIGPRISSLSPISGKVGDSVTITGTTFGSTQGGSTVTFNGLTAVPSNWSATVISVSVPAGATTGPVVVTVAGQASNGVMFAVGPKINSLSATSGVVGDSITISGLNFGDSQGASAVTFNGITATPTNWTANSITLPVPADATTGPVMVTVNGLSSNGVSFTVIPKINSLSPTSGSAGESITINGTSFGATQGSSTVKFNGTTASPTNWSATSIVVPVPGAATTGPVIVTVDGSQSNGVSFNVTTTGAVSGKVTVIGGTAPIPGATVKAIQGSAVVASTTANGTGDYSFASLTVGTYSIEASASGYGTKRRNLVAVTAEPLTVNLSLVAIVNGPVSYIYDSLGRLVSTVGPTDTIIYSYDAVGNLLSISRQSSSVVSIVNFTPGNGPVGASVTINGTGFSSTTGQNTVQFNGTSATVTSATATKIVAVVPSGATTGPISITSPNGSATSSSVFTVGQGVGPEITGFTPSIGVLGDSVTLSGTNFAAAAGDNKVKFNNTRAQITSASPTSIVTRVSTTVSSKISVTTPNGTHVAAGDFFVPPPPRTAADVEYTNRMSIDQSLTPSFSTPNKIAMVLFDGVAGQRISIGLGPATNTYNYIDFYKPDGSTLIDSQILVPWANNKFVEPFALPSTGTYTIVVRGDGTTTGATPISLWAVPPDISGTITVGGPAEAVTNTVPGQNANLTFTGTQGQQISLLTSGSTIIGSVTIKKPDGTDLSWGAFHNPGMGPEAYIDKQTLPITGTYTVFVNPGGKATGTTNVRLYDASDATGSITPGGGPTTATNTNPGQNTILSFNGTNGQRIALSLSSSGIAYDVYIKKPDGTVVRQIFINSGWTGGFIDTFTLDTSGTHTILVDPYGSFTGTVTLNLFDVPADLTGSLTIGNPAIPIGISAVGQNANYTFEGAASQQVTVRVTGSNYGCVLVSLLDSGGATLTSAGPCITNFNLTTWTLPTTGTYTVKVDPSAASTGTLNVNITNP